ncbi:hypothetical protein [Pseudoalteromonas sp. R3]|uniref:hypothetical protein n=1 Tax=Pseudoalteromonas sp. R3 TaxID=1709477 RepID=UPI0006B4D966|nr:hypothetical protein [Pseudoalteromonas sp. R3]AZZ98287.1 hypothetical protein ELR70_14870 [Pseudoalteromonas sp. R3]
MGPIAIAVGLAKLTGLDEKLGDWLSGSNAAGVANKVIDIAKTVTGTKDPANLVDALSSNDTLQTQFRLAVLNKEQELAILALKNVQGARQMQQAALDQDDRVAKRFIYYFSWFWAIATSLYIAAITFVDIPEGSERFADTILGFLLGTTLGAILNFFYGSSQGSKSKTDLIGRYK